MGNLLFSPSGRIGPGEFMKGAIILIVVATLLSLPGILGLPEIVENIFSLLSIVTLWCWIVLWVKRYHDGGKSGWMSFIPIIVYLIVFMIVLGIVAGGPFMEFMNASMAGSDPDTLKELEDSLTKKIMLPVTIASIVVSFLVAFLFNKMIKQDMHDNQYGPHPSTAETFN